MLIKKNKNLTQWNCSNFPVAGKTPNYLGNVNDPSVQKRHERELGKTRRTLSGKVENPDVYAREIEITERKKNEDLKDTLIDTAIIAVVGWLAGKYIDKK